jgi:hypothetical protein
VAKKTPMGKRKSKAKAKTGAPVVRARRAGAYDGDMDEHDQPIGPIGSRRFWQLEGNADCAAEAWTWVDRLRTQHVGDAMMDLVHEAIYRGRPVGSNQATAGRNYLLLRSGALINLNVVMSMVDTATARLCKKRPMPVISADDANYTERHFAKRCSRILRRKIGGTQIAEVSPMVIRDMCIRGDGVFKAEAFSGDVHHRRIPIYELVMDPFECDNGGARTMAHVRPEDRSVMMARYPKFAEQIAEAAAYSRNEPWANWAYHQQTASDYIEVRELWHLPSIPGAEDGQHIVTIKGCVVYRREWKAPIFPIVRPQWSSPARGAMGAAGWRGGGLVEQLLGVQEQINDILRDLREALKYGSQLTIFVQRGSNVNKHQLRKRHPAVLEYDGVEPHYVAPNPVSEQAIRILMLLIEQAYQITGISQMAAQSKNTLGAGASGKAINTMDDLQSDRFAHVESGYQSARVTLGAVTVYMAKDLYKQAHPDKDDECEHFDEEPDPIPKGKLAAWIEGTDWSKLDLERGNFHLVLEPINYLADSREGRLDQVSELGKNGLIPDPSIQADLFDEPDIQAANRIILGPKHKLDMIMEGLADPEVPLYELQPDQYTNLALGVLMAKGELNEAEASRKFGRDDPDLETVCERFREWIELAKNQIKISKAGDMSASPPGMMADNMGAAPNAMDLQPGLMPGAAPMPAPGPAGPMPPPMM